jgi:hypothetical protein
VGHILAELLCEMEEGIWADVRSIARTKTMKGGGVKGGGFDDEVVKREQNARLQTKNLFKYEFGSVSSGRTRNVLTASATATAEYLWLGLGVFGFSENVATSQTSSSPRPC